MSPLSGSIDGQPSAMKTKTYYCRFCGKDFESTHLLSQAYCSRGCEGKAYRVRHDLHKLKDGRFCKQCGKKFYPKGSGENNKQHCSGECSIISAKESRTRFWKNQPNPEKKLQAYRQKSRNKLGPDGNLKRFFRRYPNAPRYCEACGETRVVELAHKPGFKRNGAWRSVENTRWPEKVWVLCPTCHALLDRMGYSPEELGLETKKGGDANARKQINTY